MKKEKLNKIKNLIGSQINKLSKGVIDGLTCVVEVNEILDREINSKPSNNNDFKKVCSMCEWQSPENKSCLLDKDKDGCDGFSRKPISKS